MVKNIIALWIVVWASVCFGGEYTVLSSWPDSYESKPSERLEIFFKKAGGNYVPAARITNGLRSVALTNISQLLRSKSKKKFTDNPHLYSRNKKGSFEIYGACVKDGKPDPDYKDRLLCEDNQGNKEFFYVKFIHHTGVTEGLLDMPECSVELGSDSVELSFDNSKGHNNRNEIYPYQTIIDPEHVKTIRNCIEQGKIFVIDVQGIGNNKPAAYKVLGYKNNAYIHWDGWRPMHFFWNIGKDLELSGFERAEDVRPEEKIELDLKKDHAQLWGYKTRKNLREMFYLLIALCASFKLYDSWK